MESGQRSTSSCQQVLGPTTETLPAEEHLETQSPFLEKNKIKVKDRLERLHSTSRTRFEKIRAHAANTEANEIVKKNIRADKRAYSFVVVRPSQSERLVCLKNGFTRNTKFD